MSIIDTSWSENKRRLTVRRASENGGVLTTTYEWHEPPSEDVIETVLSEVPKALERDVTDKDAGHHARRLVLPFGLRIYLHHDWGPPRWSWPKIQIRANRTRLALSVGWIYHCYGITFATQTSEDAETSS